jgi:hypothetical protein
MSPTGIYAAHFIGVLLVYAALLTALLLLFHKSDGSSRDGSRAGGSWSSLESGAVQDPIGAPGGYRLAETDELSMHSPIQLESTVRADDGRKQAVPLPKADFELPRGPALQREPGIDERTRPLGGMQQAPVAETRGLARLADGLVAALESPGLKRPKLREMLAMARGFRKSETRRPEGREVAELRDTYDVRRAAPLESRPDIQIKAHHLPAPSASGFEYEPATREEPPVDLRDALPISIMQGRAEVPTRYLDAPQDAVFGADERATAQGTRDGAASATQESAEDRIMRLHIRGSGML